MRVYVWIVKAIDFKGLADIHRSGATWKPEYDFHFNKVNTTTDSRKFTLTTSAIIRQSTGENWENARSP